jgi:hypothetical protein
MTAAITHFATWSSGGVSLNAPPQGPSKGPLGAWAEAPPLSKVHPRARRPHPSAKQLVQLAATLLGERRIEGLGLLFGTASGCAQPDREFQKELDTKGWPLGGPSLFVYTLPTAAAGEMSIALGATGPLLTVNAGATSGLTAVARGLEWLKTGRCPAVLVCCAELGVADEQVAIFLIEDGPGRGISARAGFGSPPAAGAAAGPLELAAALSSKEPAALLGRDERGFWASLTVEAAR